MHKHLVSAAVGIALLVVLAFLPSLQGEFQFDDDPSIIENQRVREPLQLLDRGGAGTLLAGGRPFTDLTFALNYAVHGTDVTGYHLLNMFLHLAVVALVYLFSLRVLHDAGHGSPKVSALITAGIFGIHPIQTEAVSYLSQRAEVLASLCYLATLLLLINARRAGMHARGIIQYAAGGCIFLAGIGAKEIVLTMPLMYLLYDWYFGGERPALRRVAPVLPYLLLGLLYGLSRIPSLLEGTTAGFKVPHLSVGEYVLTQGRVVATYLRLLLLPVNQTLDYDYPVLRSLFDLRAIVSIMLVSLIVFAAIRFRKRYRVGSFGVLWFFLVLAPTSTFIPVTDVIFEHRLYLASWGLIVAGVLAVSAVTSRFARPPKSALLKHVLSGGTLVIITGLLFAAAFERNKVWHTKASLWQDAARKAPAKARVHNNLGNCYLLGSAYAAAAAEYQQAIALDRNWYEAYYNLGMTLERMGRNADAAYYFLFFAREAPDAYRGLKTEIFRKYGLSG